MKYIFVTGGVCSSLGKGVAASSIACLLENAGYDVSMQKMDPYINLDPGTMSPYQHGEVFVTDDGAETDLDLGNYERFTANATYSQVNSISTGQIYRDVIDRERAGGYLGKTVQIIPHITNEIKSRIKAAAKGHDILIVEIGGTVGDIESIPFLEAIRQFGMDVPQEDRLYIHLTLVPYLQVAHESKTKPTQHSVRELRNIGVPLDILMCRTTIPLDHDMKEKLAMFCNVSKDSVFSANDISTTIYEIPMIYKEEGIAAIIEKKLQLDQVAPDLTKWEKFFADFMSAKKKVKIAIAGKYIDHTDAYKSIYEALTHAGVANGAKLELVKVKTDDVDSNNVEKLFKGVDGILVPGGFGERGFEGMIETARYARENKIPYFGICLGLHVMAVEFARNVVGLKDAGSTEFNVDTPHPVISLLADQKKVTAKGGTQRLGVYSGKVKQGSKLFEIYKTEIIEERHRHRYEFSSRYMKDYEEKGIVFSVINPDNDLVEAMEYKNHPWYISVQFHPEFKSKPISPAPLFVAFIKAALIRAEKGSEA